MEKDILKIINEESEEKYKLLAIFDNKYILYTTLSNNNPTSDINIIKVKSLTDLEVIPIDNNEIQEIEQKYLKIIK